MKFEIFSTNLRKNIILDVYDWTYQTYMSKKPMIEPIDIQVYRMRTKGNNLNWHCSTNQLTKAKIPDHRHIIISWQFDDSCKNGVSYSDL